MTAPARRVCLITGAGGSIGAALADVLARQGVDLALVDTMRRLSDGSVRTSSRTAVRFSP